MAKHVDVLALEMRKGISEFSSLYSAHGLIAKNHNIL